MHHLTSEKLAIGQSQSYTMMTNGMVARTHLSHKAPQGDDTMNGLEPEGPPESPARTMHTPDVVICSSEQQSDGWTNEPVQISGEATQRTRAGSSTGTGNWTGTSTAAGSQDTASTGTGDRTRASTGAGSSAGASTGAGGLGTGTGGLGGASTGARGLAGQSQTSEEGKDAPMTEVAAAKAPITGAQRERAQVNRRKAIERKQEAGRARTAANRQKALDVRAGRTARRLQAIRAKWAKKGFGSLTGLQVEELQAADEATRGIDRDSDDEEAKSRRVEFRAKRARLQVQADDAAAEAQAAATLAAARAVEVEAQATAAAAAAAVAAATAIVHVSDETLEDMLTEVLNETGWRPVHTSWCRSTTCTGNCCVAATDASRSAKVQKRNELKRKASDDEVAVPMPTKKRNMGSVPTTARTAETASSSSAAAPADLIEEGDAVVRDAMDNATNRNGERKRQREAKIIKENAVKRRSICTVEEATTPAQAVLARMLAKVQQKGDTTG